MPLRIRRTSPTVAMDGSEPEASSPFIPCKGTAAAKLPRVFFRPPSPTAGGSSESHTISVIDPLTGVVLPVSGAGYGHASCLHSAGGWLLMLSGDMKPFLAEPRTGRRVDLPAMSLRPYVAAVFSVARGFPDTVVLFDREPAHPHVLACRLSNGAGEWESFRHTSRERDFGAFTYGAIVGDDEVCYVDAMGRAVTLDLRSGCWRVTCAAGWGRRNVGRGRQFFLADETAIVRIHCPPPCYRQFRFSKLDRRRGEWVSLAEEELDGTAWFLSSCMSGQRCFVVRRVHGRKAYLLSPDDEKRDKVGGPNRILRPLPAVQRGNVYVHDLDADT